MKRTKRLLIVKTGVKPPLTARQEPPTLAPVLGSVKKPWPPNHHLFLPSFALDIA